MPFIPHTPDDVQVMFSEIGAESIEELFDEIPAGLRADRLDEVPEGVSEMEMLAFLIAAGPTAPACGLFLVRVNY